jgi:hypothetical protein
MDVERETKPRGEKKSTEREVNPDASLNRTGFHVQRLCIMVIGANGMLGTFLPWIQSSAGHSANGTSGPGWITFGLYAAAMLVTLRAPLSEPIRFTSTGIIGFAGFLASAVGFFTLTTFQNKMAKDASADALRGLSFSIGIGLYLAAFAGVGLCIVAAVSCWKYHQPDGFLR